MSKWAMVALGELIESAKVSRAGDSEFPLLSMTMHNGLVLQSTRFEKRIASRDTSTYKVVKQGQLVVGFPIDEGVLDFQDVCEEGIVSPAYQVWDIRAPETVDANYLGKYLKSDQALNYYSSKLRGSTARRRSLPQPVFLEMDVPLPPIEEQRRIAKILDRWDGIQGLRKHSFELVRELQAASFTDLFGGPATWIDRWPMGTIGDITESTQYGTSEKSGPNGSTPVLRMGNITTDGRLVIHDLKYMDLADSDREKHTVRRGDILFNRTNSPELVGKTAVVRTDDHYAFAGYLIRLRLVDEFEPDFISGYLNSAYGKVLLRSMSKSIVGQANINAKELRRIPIALPPASVQREYSDVVVQVGRQSALLSTSESALNAILTSLQSRAFRGEL